LKLTNKVAAITGAGSGIGQALAVQLAQADCELALADISEDGLKQTRELLEPYGVVISVRKLDVADRDAVYQWADEVVTTHGRVNVVFNNAGLHRVAPAGPGPDRLLRILHVCASGRHKDQYSESYKNV